jgi:hypothetical protein
MRVQEIFGGCRALSYCIISNHFLILLEVPPMSVGAIHVISRSAESTAASA